MRKTSWVLGYFLIIQSPLLAQDKGLAWPQFRGPTGQGVSLERNLPVTWDGKSQVAWKTDLPAQGTSTPIVVGNRIYLTGNTGKGDTLTLHLHWLDLKTGAVLGQTSLKPKLPEQASIRENHGYASNTPAADADRIYCFFGKSGVVAFDHEGNKQWHVDVGSGVNGWGSGTSVLLYKDLVIVNASVESQSLVALDKKTGTEKWRAPGIRESWNTPILVPVGPGKVELVVAIQGKILGLDPNSGQLLWTCATDIGWYMVPSLVADAGIVYALGGRSGTAALAVRAGGKGDVTKTHRLWTSKKGSNVTSPILHEGKLYWMNDNLGIAYCAEAKTGNILYENRLDGASQVYASPILANGKIYYLTRTGQTFVVAASPKFQVLATNNFGVRDMFNSSPAVADGKLLIRSDRYLYALGAR